MTSVYATLSDVLAYPKVSTKTLLYRPSQKASCRQINFCLLFMPHMYYTSIIIQAFIYLDHQWSGQESMTASSCEKFSQLTLFNTNSPQSWRQIADILNSMASPQFRFSPPSVRKKFMTLPNK